MKKFVSFERVVTLSQKRRDDRSICVGEELETAFYEDLDDILLYLNSRYGSSTPEECRRLTSEQRQLWLDLALIGSSFPELLDTDKWTPLIINLLSSGTLPEAALLIDSFDIDPADAAPFTHLYLFSPRMRDWIIENWDECKVFRDSIAAEMKKTGIYDARLAEKCKKHRGRKFLVFFLLAVLVFYLLGSGEYNWHWALLITIGLALWGIWEYCVIRFRNNYIREKTSGLQSLSL